jgi:N-acetyl-anhydromuramyl-L-alanine amidase AmpD
MLRRRLFGLAATVIAVFGMTVVAGPAANAAPEKAASATFLSSGNPSGKTDRHGRPLSRPGDHTKPTPLTMAQTVTPTPECPPTIRCTFVPAAYAQDDPNDPSNYGNYDLANRPADGMTINQIVWHDIEGTCPEAIAAFQDPLYYVSAHYLVCTEANGSVDVVQMVETKNVAWHAGNYGVNMHAIGVEIAGFAASGSGYTPRMYWVAAELGKYLAGRFHIRLDAQHMGGHQNVPPPNAANVPLMHMDPGPFFNWQALYGLLGVPVYTVANPLTAQVGVVAPVWPLNKQTVTGCFPDEPNQCANTNNQPTSLVYVHTAASDTSPLVTDPVLGAGTTDLGNNAAKAYYGQQFMFAGQPQVVRDGIWYKMWYDGQIGYIFSPWRNPTIFAGRSAYVTPKPGLASIPVYGRAYPDAQTYPSGFSGPAVVTLPYSIAAGQKYTVAQTDVPTQWYNNNTFDYSQPYDHVVFTSTASNDQYVVIQFNGRMAYFKLSDVVRVG